MGVVVVYGGVVGVGVVVVVVGGATVEARARSTTSLKGFGETVSTSSSKCSFWCLWGRLGEWPSLGRDPWGAGGLGRGPWGAGGLGCGP